MQILSIEGRSEKFMVTTPADAISDCVPSYVEIVLWAQVIGGFREGFGQEIIVRIDGGDVQFRSWVRGAGRGFVGAKVERGRFVHACHYRRILVLQRNFGGMPEIFWIPGGTLQD